ncbi:16S rRNA pseudouridylate synthase [Prochlorococcus marinus subsp. marinus str. CCMP1375]|uniref:Pseudouridine synthase n=1 Tax=Prochlorococcus marinus (strain SARG / CCMP1375 / SS120) TaxID=167539 RepID=Q7VBH8_PROMA|nr:16S rRNA pseudouridylate synthase [Prochlorococcus marinus subsp. marinus str. CCMP1375]
MKERLQKIISNSGICSRKKAEALIDQKRVFINNEIASLGEKADILIDIIRIDDYIIPKNIKSSKVILLNKPTGVISTCRDTHGRKTVLDLLPDNLQKGMHPVGRLDKDSRGALIISNNGLLTLHLTHPRFNHKKRYSVLITGVPSKNTLKKWRNGIEIDKKTTRKALVNIVKRQGNNTLLEIVLFEGRNRQIRKVADKLGHPVIDLIRIEIGNIKLNGLKEGAWREINELEWNQLIS